MTPTIDNRDAESVTAINARIPGWSGLAQYAFFKALFASQDVRSLLMLGVCHGRDLAYVCDILRRYHPGKAVMLCGVDKFNDAPCDDWTEKQRELGWQGSGFGEPPSLAAAERNLSECLAPENGSLFLTQDEDVSFLAKTNLRFDAVYLDTAHDYETVQRQLRQVPRVCNRGAILCGDDYSDRGTWGVKRAVTEAFTSHQVFAEWIWYAPLSALKQQPTKQ